MSDKNNLHLNEDVNEKNVTSLSDVTASVSVSVDDSLSETKNPETSTTILDSPNDAEKLQDLKSTLLDSAELATRGASLAVKAGVEMHHAAEKLMASTVDQQKFNKIILLAFGTTMTLAIVLFTVMAFRMQSKISQLDAMVLAVGKRVVAMDASIELVSNASELIKDVSIKQDALTSSQNKLESRIDESIKVSQIVPDLKAKPPEDKNKEIKLLLQNLDSKIQLQANSTKLLASQINKLQISLPDPQSFKRELESASRLLKERHMNEAASAIPVPVVVKPKEKVVQFPRIAQPAAAVEKP